jgi:hypothetical protein
MKKLFFLIGILFMFLSVDAQLMQVVETDGDTLLLPVTKITDIRVSGSRPGSVVNMLPGPWQLSGKSYNVTDYVTDLASDNASIGSFVTTAGDTIGLPHTQIVSISKLSSGLLINTNKGSWKATGSSFTDIETFKTSVEAGDRPHRDIVASADVTDFKVDGDINHVTVSGVVVDKSAGAVSGAVDTSFGFKLFDMPAGVKWNPSSGYAIIQIKATTQTADTPDAGIGSGDADGDSQSLLSADATYENILTGQTMADANDTALEVVAASSSVVLTGGAVYFNFADGWAGADADVVVNLTFKIDILFLD